jgi:hypothetical protein
MTLLRTKTIYSLNNVNISRQKSNILSSSPIYIIGPLPPSQFRPLILAFKLFLLEGIQSLPDPQIRITKVKISPAV